MESVPVISRGDLTKKGGVVSEVSSESTLKIMSARFLWHYERTYLGERPYFFLALTLLFSATTLQVTPGLL